MKCHVRLTRAVELIVEGKSENEIMDWLRQNTPEAVYLDADGNVTDEYSEEIICQVSDDSEVNYVIKEEE
jgi:hypothetical protein